MRLRPRHVVRQDRTTTNLEPTGKSRLFFKNHLDAPFPSQLHTIARFCHNMHHIRQHSLLGGESAKKQTGERAGTALKEVEALNPTDKHQTTNTKALTAFDLAVTSGLQQGAAAASAASGGRAAEDYEARKRAHLQTATACANEGLQFVPLVAEAAGGGWAPVAMKTWRQLAQCMAARSGDDAALELDRLLQTLAVALQRENARAFLRRARGLDGRPPGFPAPLTQHCNASFRF